MDDENPAKMGDILEHWEQRVVVVVPGDLCLDHQHSDLLHLQVLFDRAIDILRNTADIYPAFS